jgi:hypothetical protein
LHAHFETQLQYAHVMFPAEPARCAKNLVERLMISPGEDRQTWQAVLLWTCLGESRQLQDLSLPTVAAGSTSLHFVACRAVFAALACGVFAVCRHSIVHLELKQVALDCFASHCLHQLGELLLEGAPWNVLHLRYSHQLPGHVPDLAQTAVCPRQFALHQLTRAGFDCPIAPPHKLTPTPIPTRPLSLGQLGTIVE